MNSCDDYCRHLSALLDDELSPEQADTVRRHLETCSDCQKEWESISVLDDQLRRVLTIDDPNQRVGTIDDQSPNLIAPSPAAFGSLRVWVSLIVAVAATLLFTFFYLRNERSSDTPRMVDGPSPSGVVIVARLVRATGSVEMLAPGMDQWDTVDAFAGTAISKGTRLRTSPSVLCEVQTTEKGKLRLNETGEVVLHGPRTIELVKGQLWCLAPDQSGIDLEIAVQDNAESLPAKMTCPSASEFQCVSGNGFASCDSVSTGNSKASLSVGNTSCSVNPGETVTIDSKLNVDRKLGSNVNAKVWQLPLLAAGNAIDQELRSSMTTLLAPIGMSKARHLNEQQIRRLGPRGAIPLLAYALTETSPDRIGLRRTAVSIACDLANENAIEMLQRLKSDPDAYISRYAGEALARIAVESR